MDTSKSRGNCKWLRKTRLFKGTMVFRGLVKYCIPRYISHIFQYVLVLEKFLDATPVPRYRCIPSNIDHAKPAKPLWLCDFCHFGTSVAVVTVVAFLGTCPSVSALLSACPLATSIIIVCAIHLLSMAPQVQDQQHQWQFIRTRIARWQWAVTLTTPSLPSHCDKVSFGHDDGDGGQVTCHIFCFASNTALACATFSILTPCSKLTFRMTHRCSYVVFWGWVMQLEEWFVVIQWVFTTSMTVSQLEHYTLWPVLSTVLQIVCLAALILTLLSIHNT